MTTDLDQMYITNLGDRPYMAREYTRGIVRGARRTLTRVASRQPVVLDTLRRRHVRSENVPTMLQRGC